MDYNSEEEFDVYINERIREERPFSTRKVIRDFQNPLEYYNGEEFKKRYRFTKDVVIYVILPLVKEDLNKVTKRGLPILPIYQLFVALRFYASGSFQIITGDLIQISQATISRIVKRVSKLICLKVQQYIKFPSNIEAVIEHFYTIAHFPGIVGAVDGTHIPIQNPGGPSAEVFRNRKKFFSINVQIVCGPDLKIYDIVADRPGSVHDNRIFQDSALKRKLECGYVRGILLGDSGYGCQRYLLTPVPQPQTNSEENYNKSHIKTRNVVERTIGVWKRIFPCLSKKMALNLTTTCHTIVATAVLYNICRDQAGDTVALFLVPKLQNDPCKLIIIFLNVDWKTCKERVISRGMDWCTGREAPVGSGPRVLPHPANNDQLEAELDYYFSEALAEMRAAAGITAIEIDGHKPIDQVQIKVQAAVMAAPAFNIEHSLPLRNARGD